MHARITRRGWTNRLPISLSLALSCAPTVSIAHDGGMINSSTGQDGESCSKKMEINMSCLLPPSAHGAHKWIPAPTRPTQGKKTAKLTHCAPAPSRAGDISGQSASATKFSNLSEAPSAVPRWLPYMPQNKHVSMATPQLLNATFAVQCVVDERVRERTRRSHSSVVARKAPVPSKVVC